MKMVIYNDRIVIRKNLDVKIVELPNTSLIDILNNALYLYEAYDVSEIWLLEKYRITYKNLLELFNYAVKGKFNNLTELVSFLEKLADEKSVKTT